MGPAKGLADQVEKWISWVPGVGTYLDREKRRETDKKIREHVAGRLQEARALLRRTMLEFSRSGKGEHLIDLDHLSAQIQQMSDTIRYASYGYGGIFDLDKIREEEIQRLCFFDLSLKEDAEKLQGKIEEITPDISAGDLKRKVLESGAVVVSLQGNYRRRKDFMSQKAQRDSGGAR
jgi:hypothetical protein